MTLEDANNQIRSFMKDTISDVETLPTQFDNQDALPDPQTAGMWCRFTISPGESYQVTIGKIRRERTVGVVFAQLFIGIGEGDGDLYKMAVKIKKAFKAITIGSVIFKIPSIKRVGQRDGSYQINVECPFQFDELS